MGACVAVGTPAQDRGQAGERQLPAQMPANLEVGLRQLRAFQRTLSWAARAANSQPLQCGCSLPVPRGRTWKSEGASAGGRIMSRISAAWWPISTMLDLSSICAHISEMRSNAFFAITDSAGAGLGVGWGWDELDWGCEHTAMKGHCSGGSLMGQPPAWQGGPHTAEKTRLRRIGRGAH